MLNYAIRYRPIVETLDVTRPPWVLEVGSGPEGLAMFWRGRVVASDLHFKRRPLRSGIRASALALPFANRGCPTVVSCDMLEHLPPDARRAAVLEMARVAGEWLLWSFPSGEGAQHCYRGLAQRWGSSLPGWLEEHLGYGLPDANEVAGWLREAGWRVTLRWYESAAEHARLLRWEQRMPVRLLSYGAMRLAGPWVAPRVPIPTGGEPLRVLLCAHPAPSNEKA